MKATRLVTIAVVSILLLGGAAALGAAVPADQANHNASDAHENTPDDAADDHANDERVGPSDGLPAQVPDHVSDLHDRIESFLSGSVDNLGESLRELFAGGDPADDASETDDVNDSVGSDTNR